MTSPTAPRALPAPPEKSEPRIGGKAAPPPSGGANGLDLIPELDVTALRRLDLDSRWLLTNGIGGFAMGTAVGANAHRYHGWLIAATRPPVGRILALHSIVEEVAIGGRTFSTTTQSFGEDPLLHPDGWKHLTDFAASPRIARWTYRLGDLLLSRTLRLVAGRNALHVEYEIENAPGNCSLRLRPLAAMRDFHALGRADDAPPAGSIESEQRLLVSRGDLTLALRASAGAWQDEPDWWYNFAYPDDQARGQEWHEDVWSPGALACELKPRRGRCRLAITAELVQPHYTIRPPKRVARTTAPTSEMTPRERLECAADQFIVCRQVGGERFSTVIAGYPWFADWGRDTMISLPGLMLATGREKEAAAALLTFARHMKDGLIPNRFDDYTGGAHYNTVDASLWFIHAVRELDRRKPIRKHRAELLDACRAIVRAYREGTVFDIRMDDDWLISAGGERTQLTWMDAQRDGVTFTPRHGKAVEINTLWHHGLHCLAEMTESPEEAKALRELAARVADSFRRSFWWTERQCCYDALLPPEGNHAAWIPVEAIRPNQIFAASLEHSPLMPEQRRGVVNIVRERLLTPFGLRTLDPADPHYRGRFEGDLMQRDAAYHQGTVWPWLIGPYGEALKRTGAPREEIAAAIEPLLAELDRGCFGQLAEVYDGDPPHRASGCPAQAWSVAEMLRVVAMLDEQTP